ncbi:MAG: N(4)-(beta-N-acetylglucosaminyl)-L-asparaginase [Caldilineaceae bacterium]|nr:N(4)-(beta-N-acetylglucosaminyl)-L-asparaginase [Caldilineaceae bacterium]
MLIIGSDGAFEALPPAMQMLKQGGSALDAVEAAIRIVESQRENHSVGIGGWPNLLGEVELDASIMDGRTRAVGAVGALRGYPHPISVARRVMERLPHVFVVGQGASDFAAEMGFAREEGPTDVAAREWIERIQANVPPEKLPALLQRREMAPWVSLARDPQRVAGTIDVIAIDGQGNIASGVSTSGWAWKYPGRLGDSPIIGAGNYCDNRYGAAACTGFGELAIRGATAHTVVLLMRMGMPLLEACQQALVDLPRPPGAEDESFMNIVAVDRQGNHCGVTNVAAWNKYFYMTPEMDEAMVGHRVFVEERNG